MIDKLNSHYSFTNPATVHEEEALTTLELVGRYGAKINEIINSQNELVNETTANLKKQNEDIKKHVEETNEIIEKHEKETIPNTVNNVVNDNINSGTFDASINKYAGDLTARVTNLLGEMNDGSTSMDAEVIDIRTDARGFSHKLAGDSTRDGISYLNRYTDYNMFGNHLIYFNWVQGGIDVSTGETNTSPNRIRTNNSVSTSVYENLYFSAISGITVGVFYNFPDGSFKNEWITADTIHMIDKTATSFRLIAKKNNEGTITPSEVKWLDPRVHIENAKFYSGLKNATMKRHYAVDDRNIEPTSTAIPNNTWFLNGVGHEGLKDNTVPRGSVLRRVFIKTVPLNGKTAKIGLWYINNKTATLKTYKTINNIQGDIVLDFDHYCEYDTVISLESADAIFKYANGVTGKRMWVCQTGTEKTTINMEDASQWASFENFSLCGAITYDTFCEPSMNVIEVGKGKDFEEIREAVESINDFNTYTIIVHPKNMPYKSFSMVRKLSQGETYKWADVPVRNISIIGLDRVNCIVESKDGAYYSPGAEIITNGTIKNLTFRSTHENQMEGADQGGYAVHIDCRTLNDVGYKMRFENCEFYSDNAPACGIGMHQNTSLTFKDCEFHSNGDPSYIPYAGYNNIVNYGTIFAHTSTLSGVKNQRLNFENCRIITETANKTLWVCGAGEYSPSTSDFKLRVNNTVILNRNNGVKTLIDSVIPIDDSSFGNNVSELNKG